MIPSPSPHTDRLSNHAPLNFDLSVFDIFAAIKTGAAISLVPEGLSAFPVQLSSFIQDQRITVWYSVPMVLTMLAPAVNWMTATSAGCGWYSSLAKFFRLNTCVIYGECCRNRGWQTFTGRLKQMSARGTRSAKSPKIKQHLSQLAKPAPIWG